MDKRHCRERRSLFADRAMRNTSGKWESGRGWPPGFRSGNKGRAWFRAEASGGRFIARKSLASDEKRKRAARRRPRTNRSSFAISTRCYGSVRRSV